MEIAADKGIALKPHGKGTAVVFDVRVVGGPYAGATVKLAMVVASGGDARAETKRLRDVGVLAAWQAAVNAEDGGTPVEVFQQLGDAGDDYDVILEIGVNRWRGGVDYSCSSVTAVKKV